LQTWSDYLTDLHVKSNGQTEPGRHVSTGILHICFGLPPLNIFITDIQENGTSPLTVFINDSSIIREIG